MPTFQTAIRSHVGLVRKTNEDSTLARPDLGVWAVADGMGGEAAGDRASSTVVMALAQIPGGLDAERKGATARRVLAQAHTDLTSYGRRLSPPRTAGSTVVALVTDGLRFGCLWAGDSRAYRLRNGGFVQLTRDHSMVQEMVERGLIPAAEANTHPDAHIITRAIGSQNDLQLDAVQGDVRPGDCYLLCSDGLSRVLPDEMLQAALAGADLEVSATNLLDAVLARGAPDNVSFLLVRVA